jgi:hypothetical protein
VAMLIVADAAQEAFDVGHVMRRQEQRLPLCRPDYVHYYYDQTKSCVVCTCKGVEHVGGSSRV